MVTLLFLGTLFSGKGEGKKFVSLPWVQSQIQEKAGFIPFAGTLNLRLSPASLKNKGMLKKAKQLPIEPEKGFCPGYLIKAQVGNKKAAIVIPKVPNYPEDVLEVIAPVCLRDEFALKDGAVVAVAVKF